MFRFLPLLMFAPVTLASAQPAETDDQPSGPDITWTVRAGALHQFESDIDDGGAFSLSHYKGGVSARIQASAKTVLTASLNYDRYSFDFSDTGRFGGDPWDGVNEFSASLLLNQQLDEHWGLIALGNISIAAEQGADEGDAFTGGGGLGLSYRFNSSLTLGVGAMVRTRLEDDPRILPLVQLYWQIDEDLMLRAGQVDIAAALGPGVDLGWRLNESWQLGAGVRWRSIRFRLDDEDIAPDGVGEEQAVPLYARLSYTFGRRSSVFLFGGAAFGGSLEIDNEHGREVFDEDYDAAPFIGIGGVIRF